MAPQEKAKELIDKFTRSHWNMTSRPEVIQCSLICVDELINVTVDDELDRPRTPRDRQYWQSVKQELLKIK